LKWAGGKRQLLPELVSRIDRLGGFGTYFEPFFGGGALFFELWGLGRIKSGAVLSDINRRLIDTYRAVAGDVEAVISLLRGHKDKHGKDYYYAVRAVEPRRLDRKAARVIYLNRTCFNGLYRENSKGRFNVPMGRYRNPTICDQDVLRAASKALADVELLAVPFDEALARPKAGDLVYLDPPYVPLSASSSFTAYSKGGFTMDDQVRLAETFRDLDGRGVHVMLSNSRTDAVMEMYQGFNIDMVKASRAVSCKADHRKDVTELIVTNF